MSREKKKGTSGNAKAFITRAKALKKLQLSLPEFRRLCIVKGIYPRDPKKKVDGADKTYYLRKDIDFLAHDRLINVLRAQNAHKKKVVKAQAKRQHDELRALARAAPRARLDHVVLERYPTFADALREIDDPLCVIALFAHLPANARCGISARTAQVCRRLLNEFHHYIATAGALRRVFVSIKGYYYQAVVDGEVITWLTPHRFSQVLPRDVDYSVMRTFLDLYKCILSFVNFRLYASRNLVYPPKFSRNLLNTALELGAVVPQALESKSATTEGDDTTPPAKPVDAEKVNQVAAAAANMAAIEDESDDEADDKNENTDNAESDDDDDDQLGDVDEDADKLTVFRGACVVIGRETPFIELEFVLKSAGAAKVTREDDLPDIDVPTRLNDYTHWICDRPSVRGPTNMAVEYVQPQYVFDSINAGVQLPPSLYGVGRKLPPHLSPFVGDDEDGGYRPWYKDILERIKAGDESVAKEAAAVMYEQQKAEHKQETERHTQAAKARTDKRKERKRKRVEQRHKAVAKEPQQEADKPDERADTAEKPHKKQRRRKGKKQPASDEKTPDTDAISPLTDAVENDERPDEVMQAVSDEAEDQQHDAESDHDDSGDDDEGRDAAEQQDGKEMAKVMLSRKKMRKYQYIIREQEQQKARKDKLVAKRRALETAVSGGAKQSSKRSGR